MKGDKIQYYKRSGWFVFGGLYVLAEPYSCQIDIFPDIDIVTEFVQLTKDGRISLKKYYCWDGASGLTVDTKSTMRTSLLHDATFQLFRLGLLDLKWFGKANDNLRDIGIEDGMYEWRANMWHSKIVQRGMKSAATDKKYEAIITAP